MIYRHYCLEYYWVNCLNTLILTLSFLEHRKWNWFCLFSNTLVLCMLLTLKPEFKCYILKSIHTRLTMCYSVIRVNMMTATKHIVSLWYKKHRKITRHDSKLASRKMFLCPLSFINIQNEVTICIAIQSFGSDFSAWMEIQRARLQWKKPSCTLSFWLLLIMCTVFMWSIS